jgi:hypothetical protein
VPPALSGPQDAQDDDPALILKDEVDNHALVVFAEYMRAHVPIRPLAIVGFAAPWRGFQDDPKFGVTGASAGSAATCSRAWCSDSTEYTYKLSLAFVTCHDSMATCRPR